MSLTKNQIIIIGAAGVLVLALALILFGVLPGLKDEDPRLNISTNLEFWGVFDSTEAYGSAVGAFKGIYPGVTVNYRRFASAADYERALLNALAAGEGPDIFMIRNRALPRDINKIVPVASANFSLLALRNLFPQVVESDFVSRGAIYALPLSIDTLALYYNQEDFDQAAVTVPPKTWEEFEGLIPELSAAIGGSSASIEVAPDILSLLMLQAGTRMVNDSFTKAEFASRQGEDALNFYVKFSDPDSDFYTWSDEMPRAVDAFAEEKVSMIFGYASTGSEIRAKNPFLNFAISDVPQPERAERAIAYPNYWGYAVSRQSRKQNLAWEFVLNLTTNKNNAKSFIDRSGRPPALRSLIDEKLNDPALNVFARQALVARSWLQVDPDAVSTIFSDAIRSVIQNQASVGAALNSAERQITQLMERRI
jgi:multiple sugar transport system substrate-binding protein